MPKPRKFHTRNKTTSLDQLPDNVRFIVIATANAFKCASSDLWAVTRQRYLADARHIAMCIIYENYGSYGKGAGYTLEQIGQFFNRHHSTIIHAINSTKILCRQDEAFFAKYKEIYANANIMERRPSVTKFVDMYEDLNHENALKAKKYIEQLLNEQGMLSNRELLTSTKKELLTT